MKRLFGCREILSGPSRGKILALLGLLASVACGCAARDDQLPKDFPADVPIISGEIYSARRTTFEDGKGFVVDVLTRQSYEEVRDFYADVVGPRGNGYVLVETTRGDAPTRYVTIAVHLGPQGKNTR